jgi:mRNA interferase MazF
VLLPASTCGLPKKSMVMLEQLRTLDRNRLCGYVGHLGTARMDEINIALGISIGLA